MGSADANSRSEGKKHGTSALKTGIASFFRKAMIFFGIRKASSYAKKSRPPSEVELLRERLSAKNLLKISVNRHRTVSGILATGWYRFLVGLVRAARSKDTKTAMNVLFGGTFNLAPEYFGPLKTAIENSDMETIPESYAGRMVGISIAAALLAALIAAFAAAFSGAGIVFGLLGIILVPIITFLLAVTVLYLYPFHRVSVKRQSIDTNLPFAINHMAAIASSGVPPEKAFQMMAEFKEYGAVSLESKNIVRQIDALGKDTLTAIRHTAANTPSKELKELLYGILSVIETGGNLKDYLNEMAQIALFNYQLARKKYIETLSTYADIYTAILIAAPLFLVSILAVMNIIPGSLVGSLSIEDFMKLGVYVLIPGMNIGFLLFISYSQPEM